MMRRGSLPQLPCQGPRLSQEHTPLSVDGHAGIQAQVDTHTRQEPHRHPGEGKLHNTKPACDQRGELATAAISASQHPPSLLLLCSPHCVLLPQGCLRSTGRINAMAQHPTPGGICLHICALHFSRIFCKDTALCQILPVHEATYPEPQAGESLILHTLPSPAAPASP